MKYFLLRIQLVFFKIIKFLNIQDRIKKEIIFGKNIYTFYTPNYLNDYRANTLLTKEPDTIKWIENFKNGGVFYDIGANIGLFSIFAAKQKKTICYAFEPSILNLELLYKNITINKLNNLINIIPISLSDQNKISKFQLSNLDKGGALSAFDVSYDQFGEELIVKNYYNSPGITLNDCFRIFKLEKPNYIKIDVDGIEHLVLNGANEVINFAESILVETTTEFIESYNFCENFLIEKGFKLKSQTEINNKQFNQIWIKK